MISLRRIDREFSVCKVEDAKIANLDLDYVFVSKTDEEVSIVCPTEDRPENTTACEDGWVAYRIEGTLDFSLIGILSRIASLLAEQKIPIFAISTYNTDYILFKSEFEHLAKETLKENSYTIL